MLKPGGNGLLSDRDKPILTTRGYFDYFGMKIREVDM